MSAMKFVQKKSKIRKLGGKYHKAGLLRSVNYGKRKQQNIMLMKKKCERESSWYNFFLNFFNHVTVS